MSQIAFKHHQVIQWNFITLVISLLKLILEKEGMVIVHLFTICVLLPVSIHGLSSLIMDLPRGKWKQQIPQGLFNNLLYLYRGCKISYIRSIKNGNKQCKSN
jgi:hypothetical protein